MRHAIIYFHWVHESEEKTRSFNLVTRNDRIDVIRFISGMQKNRIECLMTNESDHPGKDIFLPIAATH